MTVPIEDYALLSDGRTAALVRAAAASTGSAPRGWTRPRCSALCSAASSRAHWGLRPADPEARATRHYDGDTFCLVTRWESAEGVAEVHEWMPVGVPGQSGERMSTATPDRTDIVRRIVGIRGRVTFLQELRLRFDYARAVPWVHQSGTAPVPELTATAGPDAVVVRGALLRPDGHRHSGEVTVAAGETRAVTLTWYPSYRPAPDPLDVEAAARAMSGGGPTGRRASRTSVRSTRRCAVRC